MLGFRSFIPQLCGKKPVSWRIICPSLMKKLVVLQRYGSLEVSEVWNSESDGEFGGDSSDVPVPGLAPASSDAKGSVAAAFSNPLRASSWLNAGVIPFASLTVQDFIHASDMGR
jgi:hypothetical protein